ncbi:MAG: DUF2909 domain-containing protein [Gammaproteobacteria bacterium]|nr:DUF2909 domain-containing protein [Gammaproteobacteria bacterium]
MIGKILVLIVFVIIVYNLFMGLKYLMQSKPNSDGLLKKLKWRIALSVFLFFLIILGFLTGLIQLHTL